MKLTFNIDYRTDWGEMLYICGNIPELGSGNRDAAKLMKMSSGNQWTLTLDVADPVDKFEYHYFVRRDSGSIKKEFGEPHVFTPGNAVKAFTVYDQWQDVPADRPYYSTVFTECVNSREDRSAAAVALPDTIVLSVEAPMVAPDQTLAVCGATPGLGAWNPLKAIPMSDARFPLWEVTLNARDLPTGTEYKFLAIDKNGNAIWEDNNNRRYEVLPAPAGSAVAINGLTCRLAQAPWRGAGVAIPVFSLRSNEDFGVGDFYDIKKMVDWAASTGQTFVQILPINDTTMTGTWTDSYPYNANSTFALHPMYLRLSEMGTLKDKKRQKYYDDLAAELNALPEIDYERVNNGKTAFYREIFAQEGKKVLLSDDFNRFFEDNSYWLPAYAAFCVLRDHNGSPDFQMWGEYAAYDKAKVDQFIAKNQDEINFVYYLQYNLDRQMRHVRNYAHSKGVAIKGDIPIGISRTSVDAWTDTRLFNMDCQAGAPPDDFSVLGQNWGFPTYNWEEMNRDGFAWWKSRFSKMSEYFDAYRIDHVLGFFRIWQIPMDALHGLLGYFNPALPFSPDELRNSFDFWINPEVHARPYICDYFLGDFFGEYTDEARARFLQPAGYGRYTLRPEFDTQRKVADYFAGLVEEKDQEKNNRLCNGLLGLIDDVLFIEDPYEKGKYHPRISAQFTYVYRSLNDYERWCYDRLYNNFFYHRHNDFWYGKAMWKLPPLIDATNMLVCAEDLGMIPACVPAVMSTLQILALEIQRMPKDPQSEFGNTWHYPYLSVCTTSTHDMGGIRQWWEENRDKTQAYYNNVLHEGGAAPYYCEPWICQRIIDMHLKSPSMLCIIPLQDYLSMDGSLRRNDPREEQINVPANPRHYWRYRMHLTLDQLIEADGFNTMMSDMIRHSGRQH